MSKVTLENVFEERGTCLFKPTELTFRRNYVNGKYFFDRQKNFFFLFSIETFFLLVKNLPLYFAHFLSFAKWFVESFIENLEPLGSMRLFNLYKLIRLFTLRGTIILY